MRNRRIAVALGAVLLLATTLRHPTADIRVLTHDSADPTPHQVSAAVDLGVMAFSILVTWTTKRFA